MRAIKRSAPTVAPIPIPAFAPADKPPSEPEDVSSPDCDVLPPDVAVAAPTPTLVFVVVVLLPALVTVAAVKNPPLPIVGVLYENVKAVARLAVLRDKE